MPSDTPTCATCPAYSPHKVEPDGFCDFNAPVSRLVGEHKGRLCTRRPRVSPQSSCLRHPVRWARYEKAVLDERVRSGPFSNAWNAIRDAENKSDKFFGTGMVEQAIQQQQAERPFHDSPSAAVLAAFHAARPMPPETMQAPPPKPLTPEECDAVLAARNARNRQIADLVSKGRSVLVVCEAEAAIDQHWTGIVARLDDTPALERRYRIRMRNGGQCVFSSPGSHNEIGIAFDEAFLFTGDEFIRVSKTQGAKSVTICDNDDAVALDRLHNRTASATQAQESKP